MDYGKTNLGLFQVQICRDLLTADEDGILPGYNPATKRLGFSRIFPQESFIQGCQFWGSSKDLDLTWHQKQPIKLEEPLLCILLWQMFFCAIVIRKLTKRSLWEREFLFLISIHSFQASFSMGASSTVFSPGFALILRPHLCCTNF